MTITCSFCAGRTALSRARSGRMRTSSTGPSCTPIRQRRPAAEPNPGKIDRLFSKAVERRTKGRPGLYMQSRFPNRELGKRADRRPPIRCSRALPTCSRISKPGWARWPARGSMAICLRLIGWSSPEARRSSTGPCRDSAALRDYNPKSFLTNLIWNTRGERQCFQFGPETTRRSPSSCRRIRMRRSR